MTALQRKEGKVITPPGQPNVLVQTQGEIIVIYEASPGASVLLSCDVAIRAVCKYSM
jgi:hypothetical protein